MQFNPTPNWADQNLGRFRISVTDDATTFSKKQRYLVAKRISDPLMKLAVAYDLNGEPDLAAQWMDTAMEDWNDQIRSGTASPDIFHTRGVMHARLGRIEEAIADFVLLPKIVEKVWSTGCFNLARTPPNLWMLESIC